MISKEQVKHIAYLAKLKLTEEEVERFQKELSKILDYFQKLKEVNVEGIEPMSHSIWVENVMREDGEEKKYKFEFENLEEQFSLKEDGYLKVRKIIEK